MADSVISIEKLKSFWHFQVHDEEKWALNVFVNKPVGGNISKLQIRELDVKKLLRAAGLFAGSVFLMRNYGDLMGI